MPLGILSRPLKVMMLSKHKHHMKPWLYVIKSFIAVLIRIRPIC